LSNFYQSLIKLGKKEQRREEKKGKRFIAALNEYTKTTEGRVSYSLQRFDILIISLSSGGLALGSSMYENFKSVDHELINIAWIFFSSALVVNLLSQITGYWANKFDIRCTKILIEEEEGKAEIGTHKKLDDVKAIFHHSTSVLNGLSFIALATGIILIIIFVNTKG